MDICLFTNHFISLQRKIILFRQFNSGQLIQNFKRYLNEEQREKSLVIRKKKKGKK